MHLATVRFDRIRKQNTNKKTRSDCEHARSARRKKYWCSFNTTTRMKDVLVLSKVTNLMNVDAMRATTRMKDVLLVVLSKIMNLMNVAGRFLTR